MLKHIPVFYTPGMTAEAQVPSARKPAAVVASWQRQFPKVQVFTRPERLTVEQLAVAHDREWVEAVLAGHAPNGFGNCSLEIANTLPLTSGAMFSAAVQATSNGCVAVAPVSGFHHAGYAHAGGFCTFNGLVIAALLWQEQHEQAPVGILDFDAHYGNGTDEIIERLKLTGIEHFTFGEHAYRTKPARIVQRIPQIVKGMKRAGCKLILYQAGADPHVNDPLGGFLTSAQLEERDRLVFESCAEHHIPVAWNLAGGYQVGPGKTFEEQIRPVLDIHDRTMKVCCEVYLHARFSSHGRLGRIRASAR